MRVTFPKWPVWNFTFPELDVRDVQSVNYVNAQGVVETLDEDKWRMATGRNGVCSLVLLDKPNLPKLKDRNDAVIVEYEP